MEVRPSGSQRSLGSQGPDSRTDIPASLQPAGPPMEVPPRRRPQEIPERLKPATQPDTEISQDVKPRVQPTPPPTSPLPQVPTAPLSVAAKPTGSVPDVQTVPAEPEPPQNVVSPIEEKDNEAAHRPGMGPMVKKVLPTADAASKFRKAAAAAGAFKPRVGGAAAKLFAKETKTSDEPDGISGVFVPQRQVPKEVLKAPVLDQELDNKPEEATKTLPDEPSQERPSVSTGTEGIPSVTVSSPLSPVRTSPAPNLAERALAPNPEQAVALKASSEPEVRRRKRRSNQQIMNISKLGIDPTLIDERGVEFESLLSELGWGSSELSVKNIESLEGDIKREIARVEAGSSLNHLEQKDDRVDAVERMLDRAIAECDELEGLLTLYNVELGVSLHTFHVEVVR
jgi:hypothetical protein